MAINFDDPYLENQIIEEQARRSDSNKTKTAIALLRERLAQIESKCPSVPDHDAPHDAPEIGGAA